MGLCSATCSEVVPPDADEPTCAPSLCRYTYRSKSLSLLAHWIVMTTEPTCVSQKAGSRSMFKSKWSHRAHTGSIAGGHSSGSEVAPAAYKCPCQEVLGAEVEMVPVPGSAARAAGIEENNMTSPSRMTKKTSPRCPRLAIGTVRSDMLPPIFVERHKRGSVNWTPRYSCGLGHSERRRAVSDRVDCSQAQILSEAAGAGVGPSGFEPESPAPQAGRISCGPGRSPRPNQATPRTRGAVEGLWTEKCFPGRSSEW